MDEVSGSTSPSNSSEGQEAVDNSIPKINMKFDGSTWKHLHNTDDSPTEQSAISQACDLSTPTAVEGSGTGNGPGSSNAVPGQSSSPSSSTLSNDDTDGEFEPSVDAMVHDFDDETTLEEEENDADDDSEELDDLAKEGEMPIEDLMAMYYGKSGGEENPGKETEATASPDDDSESKNKDSMDTEDLTRKLRSNATFLSPPRIDSGDEDDNDYAPAPEDWKKSPRVGDEYQAELIPEAKQQDPYYDTATDKLVWDPAVVDSGKVEYYLSEVAQPVPVDPNSFHLPTGTHLRDNEDALFLLSQCNNDSDEAIRRFRLRPPSLASEMYVWSDEECKQFENGLALYGKDFHAIHHNKVKTKAIGDIVKFYYVWKKTERYDNFNAKTRLGKKKDALHPGVTDYMERLLDETENTMTSLSQHSGFNSATSTYPTTSHSAALQQHLVDLRVTRSQNTKHRSHNSYSPTHDYTEMNGLLDSDFADEAVAFDHIAPILPTPLPGAHLGNISPSVPFTAIEPTINVGYSDPGHFAPLSGVVHHPEVVSVAPHSSGANRNNNCHVTSAAAESSDGALIDSSRHSFRPLDPADVTSSLHSDVGPSATLRRTTPLPLDVLSSIDELETVYCRPDSTSSQLTSQGASTSDAPSASTPQIRPSAVHHPAHDAKRRKLSEEVSSSSDATSAAKVPLKPKAAPYSQDALDERPGTSNFQKAQTQGGRDKMSDPVRLVSC